MACYDSGSYACTYDSNAGAGKDYSSLATWETASDNDLSGTGRTALDCYDSQNHDNSTYIAGASNTDATHYRVIRSADSCTTPFAGKDGTGANFVYTGSSSYIIYLDEDHARAESLSLKYAGSYSGDGYPVILGQNDTIAAHLCIYDCDSSNGTMGGVYCTRHNQLIYSCICRNCTYNAFRLQAEGGETIAVIACTAISSGAIGIYASIITGTAIAFSCYAADNTTSDFNEVNWDSPSDYNSSKDNTSDLGGASSNYNNGNDLTGSMDADYLLTASNTQGRNPYNDVTATSDFNDFLRNDTAGDALFSKSIEGNTRPGESTADYAWAVGASEYVTGGATDVDASAVSSASDITDAAISAIRQLAVSDPAAASQVASAVLTATRMLSLADVSAECAVEDVLAAAISALNLTTGDVSAEASVAVAALTAIRNLAASGMSVSTEVAQAALLAIRRLTLSDPATATAVSPAALVVTRYLPVSDVAAASAVGDVIASVSGTMSPATVSMATEVGAVLMSAVRQMQASTVESSSSVAQLVLTAVRALATADVSATSSVSAAILQVISGTSFSVGDISSLTEVGDVLLAMIRGLGSTSASMSTEVGASILTRLRAVAMQAPSAAASVTAVSLAIVSAVVGAVTITFSASAPGITFSASAPGITFSASAPGITFSVQ